MQRKIVVELNDQEKQELTLRLQRIAQIRQEIQVLQQDLAIHEEGLNAQVERWLEGHGTPIKGMGVQVTRDGIVIVEKAKAKEEQDGLSEGAL